MELTLTTKRKRKSEYVWTFWDSRDFDSTTDNSRLVFLLEDDSN